MPAAPAPFQFISRLGALSGSEMEVALSGSMVKVASKIGIRIEQHSLISALLAVFLVPCRLDQGASRRCRYL